MCEDLADPAVAQQCHVIDGVSARGQSCIYEMVFVILNRSETNRFPSA